MWIQGLTEATVTSLRTSWGQVYGFIPAFIGAIIILVIGLIVAAVLGSLVERALRSIKLDELLRKIGLATYVERAGLRLDSGKFFGKIVYWFFVIVVVLAISSILGLQVFSAFLAQVLVYLPNIVVAALIMLATLAVAKFLKSAVRASALSAKFHAAKFLGTFVWWVVVIFGFVTALSQLGINIFIFQVLIYGFVAMLAIAGGVGFGLGGKDYAAHLLNKFRQETEER
ncbi:MAG: hypothetical protein WC596_04470 [Candidatus Shapirobacteria bacterium]